jgi:hypothetical protein
MVILDKAYILLMIYLFTGSAVSALCSALSVLPRVGREYVNRKRVPF